MDTPESLNEMKSFLADLPKISWRGHIDLHQWKGFWVMPEVVKAVMAIEAQFNPLPTDIILSSFPKTGTTWLKALTVAILSHSSRRQNEVDDDPLLTHNPHELVPFLEMELFGNNPSRDIDKIPSPRVFNTHLPYSLLPDSIKKSGCRIIYIARNPMDTFVSNWHFFNSRFGAAISIEEAFDEFCGGAIPSGPFFDHVLEYWVERWREVCLFITYEELKEDPKKQAKRLAEFLGFSLSLKEIEEIVLRCSYDRLSKLDVNKNGGKVHWSGFEFGSFFRRGVVGEWQNHLSAEMMERVDQIAHQKWEGSGLPFILRK